MPGHSKSADLCSTCVNQTTCMYHRKGAPPVLECNEFDFVGAVSASRPAKVKAAADTTKPAERVRFDGVCVTCAQRGTCSLSHTPGGIWHCEEYV